MPTQVVAGTTIKCVFGAAPSVLVVLPVNRTLVGALPAANILDHKPVVNIPTFGMCTAPQNPAVIAATSAALGVPTPAPCVPVTATPWVPGSTQVLIGGAPALNNVSTCTCTWGGVITVVKTTQDATMVP